MRDAGGGRRPGFAGSAGRPTRRFIAAALAVLTGCYHYVPVATAPQPGDQVEIVLSDAGRVALANALGPEVGKVQGLYDSASDSGFVLRVTQVQGEYGGVTKWEGEAVPIRPQDIRALGQRRFSTWRTVVVVGLVTVGAVVFVATRALTGFGMEPSGSNPGGGTGNQ